MTYGVKRTGLLSHALRLTEKELSQLGRCVIIAPHPDDETLGCGGAMALLAEGFSEVHTIFVSDGSMSHPDSQAFPREARVAVRKAEALQALEALGIDDSRASFLSLPDGAVPNESDEGFADAVRLMGRTLLNIQPSTIFVPYRLDPHRDHQATWQIVQQALHVFKTSPRILEYPVWLWELGHERDYPASSAMTCWRLDIGKMLETKRRAVNAHQSQLGKVFHDDPKGFVLTPHLLAHFELPFEIFFESL